MRDTIDLHFPVAGLNRQLDYQSQPPYTTPNALNVRAKETKEGRYRGGSRPGLVKAFDQQLGGGNPVRLLNSVREITPTGAASITDAFNSGDEVTDNTIWAAASWKSGVPRIQSGYSYGGGGDNVGVTLMALSPTIDVTTSAYTVFLLTQFSSTPSVLGGEHIAEIFLRMSDSTPNVETNGVRVRLSLNNNGGTFSYVLTIDVFSSSVIVETYSDNFSVSSPIATGSFQVQVNQDGATPNRIHASATFDSNVADIDQVITTAAAGQRIGYGIIAPQIDVRVGTFSLFYTQSTTTASVNRNRIIAIANTAIYEENNAGVLIAQSDTIAQAQSKVMVSAERLGKLYVQDPGFLWQASPARRGTLMVWDSAADSGNGSYDAVVATAGTIPRQCRLVALYLDRIVQANQSTENGGENAPQMVYFSRQGDPTDWDFSEVDVGAAWATVNTEQAGKLPGPCTALVSFSDDYMIFGSHRAIYVMRGDPRVSGIFETLSHTVGIVDALAWCRDASNRVYFLSHRGIGSITSGESGFAGGIGVDLVSRARLPRELTNIDVVNNSVLLAYDVEENGVHIFITPNMAGAGAGHWFWEIESDAFWPVQIPASMEPTSMVYYDADEPGRSAVLLGCRDGYVRKFSSMSDTDDGTEFESFVDYGPIMLNSNPIGSGGTRELVGVLDGESSDVAWAVRSGDAAEAAYSASPRTDCTGTMSGGRNYTHRPRTAGRAAFVRVSGTGGQWAVEKLSLTRETSGRIRK